MNGAVPLRSRAATIASNPWIRGVAGTAGTRLTVLVVGLGSTVALARGLGPTGRGVHALAMTVATLGVVALNLGFHTANTYFAARDSRMFPTLISNTFALAASVGVAGAVLLAVITLFDLPLGPLPFRLVVLVAAWVVVGLVFIQLQPLLLNLERVRIYNLAEGGWQLTGSFLVVALWLTGLITPTSAFGATLAAFVGGTAVVVWTLRSSWGQPRRPSLPLFRRVLPFAARSYVTTLTGLALVRLDLLLVENRLGTREVGLYAVAVTICEALQVLPSTVGALLLPKLSALTDDDARWAITRRVAVVTAGLMVVICGLAAILAHWVIPLVYGQDFAPSATPLYWLLPGIALLGVNAVFLYHFHAVGMPLPIVVAQVLALGINIGLDLLLLRPLGLAGAGIASTVAYTAMFLMTVGYALWTRRRPAEPVVVAA